MNLKSTTLALIIAASLLGCSLARAAVITVSSDIPADTTWLATDTYVLQTIIYVKNNATLTIQPGTVIKGATANLSARDGIPNLVSALWVTRGAKLNANGTADRPIIFTFEGDDVNNPSDVPYNTSGQWGGIVLCGNARINSAALTAGNAADPKFERFEGTTADGADGAHLFGGADDNDNSGVVRYVSIRYPGNVFAPARELNGLTMGAVGSGTTIEYVEVLNSSDDAFEWWGGSVNTRYLVAAFCEDDDFDTDQGYRGTNQFWFGIKPPWNGSSDSRAFETDGDLNQGASGELPKSQWTVHNATLIGISYTNDLALDPRPQSASPALSNVRAQGTGLTPTTYRGAFGPNDSWADGWTALSQAGILKTGTTGGGCCLQPTVSIRVEGSNVLITSSSQTGCHYRLQSRDSFSSGSSWSNAGEAVAGSGSSVTFSQPLGANPRFYQVVIP